MYLKKKYSKYQNKDKVTRCLGCLGSIIGTVKLKKRYSEEIVKQTISETEDLSQIVKKEPQAVYGCFTAGFKHSGTYLMRTKPSINE